MKKEINLFSWVHPENFDPYKPYKVDHSTQNVIIFSYVHFLYFKKVLKKYFSHIKFSLECFRRGMDNFKFKNL